jgi:hypothetical protein
MLPALYPAYLQTDSEPSFAAYLRHWLALPFWPCGPMWFLWLLLVGTSSLLRCPDLRRLWVIASATFLRSPMPVRLTFLLFPPCLGLVRLHGVTGLTMANAPGSLGLQIAADLSFVLAGSAKCFAVLAIVLRFGARRFPSLAGPRENAYACTWCTTSLSSGCNSHC